MSSILLHTTNTISSTSPSSTTTTFSNLRSSPNFFTKTSKVCSIRKHNGHRNFQVSCKTTEDDHGHNSPIDISKSTDSLSHKMDRRNMLLGLGGLYGASTIVGGHPFAFAAPVNGPDVTQCGPANLPPGASPVNCCPPTTGNIIDFQLPPPSTTPRTRPVAHSADSAYIEKFNRAIQLMKQLPDDDPRSFRQQANVHCAYCDGAYEQLGFPNTELQVHGSWLFLPFHRCYLYFFERILGNLIDDPTFAMPFWNWDHPDGMRIPAMYTNPSSPLYDPLRDRRHQPPTLVDLDFDGTDPNISNTQQTSQNLTVMYRQMVSLGSTPETFLGDPYRAGGEPGGAGSLENIPHGPVHVWTGDRTQPNFENMGDFYSAARDPIFYAHHSNIDRLWIVWKTLGGRRQDFTDPDFLNASFIFYDENAQMVRIRVRDCLDARGLGYVYQDVTNPWQNSRPTPRGSRARASANNDQRNFLSPKEIFPTKLDHVINVMVKRPNKKKRSRKEKKEKEEILVVEGLELERDVFVKFDVLINDEDETLISPDQAEFAGSFVNVPHHNHGTIKKKRNTKLKLVITELLEDLDAEDDENVLVTFVPKHGSGAVQIGGVKIVLD
ncbi:polyphenol oxidase, chloroplastic-like [Lycium ferocissimum]|uniref:polyphenol oxidase, chloroplastic-like n=1 Tax=Lycium ferocissimum TaxID=112874 RepID=UPI0028159338|nr:polyphenol oxidase, chloroplastic-like [Lycium ferocissimum]